MLLDNGLSKAEKLRFRAMETKYFDCPIFDCNSDWLWVASYSYTRKVVYWYYNVYHRS